MRDNKHGKTNVRQPTALQHGHSGTVSNDYRNWTMKSSKFSEPLRAATFKNIKIRNICCRFFSLKQKVMTQNSLQKWLFAGSWNWKSRRAGDVTERQQDESPACWAILSPGTSHVQEPAGQPSRRLYWCELIRCSLSSSQFVVDINGLYEWPSIVSIVNKVTWVGRWHVAFRVTVIQINRAPLVGNTWKMCNLIRHDWY